MSWGKVDCRDIWLPRSLPFDWTSRGFKCPALHEVQVDLVCVCVCVMVLIQLSHLQLALLLVSTILISVLSHFYSFCFVVCVANCVSLALSQSLFLSPIQHTSVCPVSDDRSARFSLIDRQTIRLSPFSTGPLLRSKPSGCLLPHSSSHTLTCTWTTNRCDT